MYFNPIHLPVPLSLPSAPVPAPQIIHNLRQIKGDKNTGSCRVCHQENRSGSVKILLQKSAAILERTASKKEQVSVRVTDSLRQET